MTTRRSLVSLTVAALTLSALAGCSSGTADTVATSAGANQAAVPTGSATDVAFAQSMIPHHQQAVEMADLALSGGSGASDQVRRLARQIKAAQDPEMQQMTKWLQGWGAPTAMPGTTDGSGMAGMDHSGHDMGGMSVSGMMTADQMTRLRQARGPRFDQLWLSMMIDHHQGAIAMAEQARSSGNVLVRVMADGIIAAQREEIGAMSALLDGGR